jgi:hypothetical protein
MFGTAKQTTNKTELHKFTDRIWHQAVVVSAWKAALAVLDICQDGLRLFPGA